VGLILDATVLIEAERGRLDLPALLRQQGDTPVAIAAITASDLLQGVERAVDPIIRHRRSRYVEGVLETVETLPFGLPEARAHARVWAALTARGQPIGAHDLLVAATALAADGLLATLDQAEFARVPDLRLLPLDRFRLPALDGPGSAG
jgi:tRNA(fMet)-specific endonuclease VapC